MAAVHLARQPDLDRLVALKELSAFHALDPALAERFSREARVAASLSHPCIVTVFEFFEHDGVPYIAMEYVEAGSLRSFMRSLWLSQSAGALEGILAGLAHAHAQGVVHRDLKPENVLVTPQGRVKLTDFGVAKAFNQVGTANYPTATGMAIGTPTYMAPEQAMGRDIGPWTDLYSVGVVAYELLAGRPPFIAGEEPLAVLMKHVTEQPQPLDQVRPEIDPRLSAWVMKLLAKEPAERYRNASQAWDALEEIVVALAGPMWRRQARIGEVDEAAAARPLTPVAFAEPTAQPSPPPLLPQGTVDTPATAPVAAAPPARRRRRWPVIAGVVAALAAVGVGVVLLTGGDSGSGQTLAGATPVTAELPDCLHSMIEGLPSTQVVPGVEATIGKASELDGKKFAVVAKLPSGVAAITYDYTSKPKDLYVAGPLKDEQCKTLKPGFYGSGAYPNAENYDGVRFDHGGKHWAIGAAKENGVVGAGVQEVADAGLKITTVAREGRKVHIGGTLAPGASGDITIRVSAKPANAPPVALEDTFAGQDGRFTGTVTLPADAADTPIDDVSASFEGDDSHAAAVAHASKPA